MQNQLKSIFLKVPTIGNKDIQARIDFFKSMWGSFIQILTKQNHEKTIYIYM